MVLAINFDSRAATITAVNSGTWNSITSWSTARLPQCGDTIIIPHGIEIKVTENLDLDAGTEACPAVKISVSGKLSFSNGKKIKLAEGACVIVEKGGLLIPSPHSGGASEAIIIGNNKIWQASNGWLDGASGWGCSIILPVSPVEFTVKNDNNIFLLSWSIASEKDLAYYKLFVSDNGVDWELIHIRVGSGSDEGAQYTYNYIHRDLTRKLIYFKLSSTNTDGSSQVLSQNSGSFEFIIPDNEELIVLPNPIKQNKLTIVAFELDNDEEYEITAIDPFGQVVIQRMVNGNKGANTYVIESHKFKTGIYTIQVKNNEKVSSGKLIVM